MLILEDKERQGVDKTYIHSSFF